MAIQRIVKRDDIIEGEYIPTIGVANKHWATDGLGSPDWRDNPALVSPLTTKGDLLGFNTTNDRLPIGNNGYELIADSTNVFGVAWKYKLNLQKEVTGSSYTILVTDDRYTIFFNSANPITVTVNDVPQDNLEVDFYNLGSGAVTFVAGTAVLGFPDGAVLTQNKVCALIKFMVNNIYKLKGELI
jgi:hypothetical protein